MAQFGTYPSASLPLGMNDIWLVKQGGATKQVPASAFHSMTPNAIAYGMVADGVTDNMPLLKSAIAAVVAAGYNHLFVPPGTYAFVGKLNTTDRAELPAGFKLIGLSAYSTTFKMLASSYSGLTSGQAVGILIVNTGCEVSGITYDGNMAGLANSGYQAYGGNFINRKNNTDTDVILRDLICKNNPGGTGYESFCIQTGWQSQRWFFDNIWCSNNHGSGISINGDMTTEYNTPGTGLAKNMIVSNCRATDNQWQGITLYGARNITISNFHAANNGNTSLSGGNGINMEWCDNITIDGGICENNIGGGVGSYGWVDNIVIGGGLILRNNNLLQTSSAGEFNFKAGSWYTGPGVNFSGCPQSITINDVYVKPKSDGTRYIHMFVAMNGNSNYVAGVANGGSYPAATGTIPSKIVINTPDAHNWVIACGNTGISGHLTGDFWLPNISTPAIQTFGHNVLSPISRWTNTSITVANLAISVSNTYGGSRSGDAYRLTAVANSTTYSSAAYNVSDPVWLKAGRKYLVHVRYRNVSGDNGWMFYIRPAGWNTNGYGERQFAAHLSTLPSDTSTWYNSYVIVNLPDTSIGQPKIGYFGTTNNAILDVEIAAYPVSAPQSNSSSHSSETISGMKFAVGTPNDEDFYVGDRIISVTGGVATDQRCTAQGSIGYVTNTVGFTATGGQNSGTLNATHPSFRPGMWINIPGGGTAGANTTKKIRGVFANGTIALDAAITTSVSNVVVNVVAPTFANL